MLFVAIFIAIILGIVILYIINSSYLAAVKNAQIHIIESLSEAVIVVDAKQTIVIFNKAAEKMTGVDTQKAIGQKIDTVLQVYSDLTLTPFTTYSHAATDPNAAPHGFRLKKADGNEIGIILMINTHIIGANHKGYLITLRDTSKEQQLEEMKVDFVSMAAHELRTPLTAIRGYASLLQMHYIHQLDESAKELLTRLIVSTTNLTNLIDNLLSVSRIERNNLTIEAKPIDITIILKDVFASFEQQALTKKQHFILQAPETLPMVMVDPFRIGQVFINLISNALNYTPEGGNITVTVSDKNTYLEISVQDTGEGIPPDALPRLFTKFFRVSGSLEQGSKGTGLGLYITKSIVELHKGKIWAESTLGKGSTFTFTLPTATHEQVQQSKETVDNQGKGFLTVKNGQGIIVKRQLMTIENKKL